MAGAQERRRYSRIDFQATSHLLLAEIRFDTQLVDISMKGALVALPVGWVGRPAEQCELIIDLRESDISIRMEMVVAHVDSETIGLRCNAIDVDSMVHLRRLLELNLGDPALVERELFQLG